MTLFVLFATDDIRFRHFVVEVIAFARSFADTGKDRHTPMELRDVIDQLHDDDSLAHAGTAERADLAAFEERADQVNDLDAGGKDLRRGRLVHQRGSRAMDGIIFIGGDGALLVHNLAGNIKDASHHTFADWHRNWCAGIRDLETAFKALSAGHGDRAHPIIPQVLLDFERQFGGLALDFVIHGQRIIDGRQWFGELDVHHRTDDLDNFTFVHVFLK